MAKIGTWSTTAGNNNSAPPDGWPEGQAPSTVNDCARELMAAVRTQVQTGEWFDHAFSPTFVNANSFTVPGNQLSVMQAGRQLQLFDATTIYRSIAASSFTAVTTVSLDAGTAITNSLSSFAVAQLSQTNPSLPRRISASAMEAGVLSASSIVAQSITLSGYPLNSVWRNKNILINGQLDVWQRGNSFSISADGALHYTVDRFAGAASGAGRINISRSERSANASNVPTLAQAGTFLQSALLVSVSTIDAAIAATDFAGIFYNVEGYDWRQIAHNPINLSFWCNTNKSGIYAVSLRNSGLSASYVQNFTVGAVNTWTLFSIPLPAAPTTPYTWDYSNGVGLRVGWTLAAGTTFQGTGAAWTSTNIFATSSQVNFLASAGNVFAIAGIKLEEGQIATPLPVCPYPQELDMCKRYFQSIPTNPELLAAHAIFGFATGGTAANFATELPVTMRSTVTSTFPPLSKFTLLNSVTGGVVSVSAIAVLCSNPGFFEFQATIVGAAVLSSGFGSILRITAEAATFIQLDAELP